MEILVVWEIVTKKEHAIGRVDSQTNVEIKKDVSVQVNKNNNKRKKDVVAWAHGKNGK